MLWVVLLSEAAPFLCRKMLSSGIVALHCFVPVTQLHARNPDYSHDINMSVIMYSTYMYAMYIYTCIYIYILLQCPR